MTALINRRSFKATDDHVYQHNFLHCHSLVETYSCAAAVFKTTIWQLNVPGGAAWVETERSLIGRVEII